MTVPLDPVDTSRPNIARVYDYLLGGKDWFPSDELLARELLEITPQLRQMLHDNRAFITRVVTWAARQRITQFADLGAGLPASPPVHATARCVIPRARVAYVDSDPLVISHACALLATSDGVAAVAGDLTHPGEVMSDPGLLAVIDPGSPVCALLALTLHFLRRDAAREVVAGYARLLAPGSVIAVSVIRNDDPGSWERARAAYTAGTLHNHTAGDVASFLGGLDLIPPGVTLARAWRGGMADATLTPDGTAYVLAGAGRVRG